MADFGTIVNWVTATGVLGLGIDYMLKRGERKTANRKNMLDEVDKLWVRLDTVEAEAEDERNKRRDTEKQMDGMARQIDKLQAVTLERDQAIKERDTAILERDVAVLERDEARRMHSDDAEKNTQRIAELERTVADLDAKVQQLQAQLDEAREQTIKDQAALRANITGEGLT